MSLDTTKLEHVHRKNGNTIARCPACKESGSDKSGEHLIIYPDGRFGCAANPDNGDHRKRIFALVGTDDTQKPPADAQGPTKLKPIKGKAKIKNKLHASLDDAIKAMQWSLQQENETIYEPRHIASYPKGGKPFGFVVRFEDPTGKNGKEPRPFHAVEGGIRAGDPDEKWPLYREGKLEPTGCVNLFEGEKKTDRAADEIDLPNCVATKGGSGGLFNTDGTLKTDFSVLKSRDVVIFPDNDDKGRNWAQTVARLATEAGAASVKIVELPGLPPAGDIADFIDDRDAIDPEQIRETIEDMATDAPVWQPAPEQEADADAKPTGGGVQIVGFRDLKPVVLQWLWPQRIPMGKLTLFAGDPDKGKSLLTIDVASRVTTGTPWPDCTDRQEKGDVIFLTVEDDLSDTVLPRAMARDADMDHLFAIQSVITKDKDGVFQSRAFNLAQDITRLKETLATLPNPRLIVFDPISAYMGTGTDGNSNTDVRSVLAPLQELAQEQGIAIVGITHLRKSAGKSMYRTMGSLAFTAAARAVWGVDNDTEDETEQRKVFLPIKNNLAANPDGLAYTIGTQSRDGIGEQPIIQWERNPISRSEVEKHLSGEPGRPSEKRSEAEEFLSRLMRKNNGEMRATDAIEAGEIAGHKKRTLHRAKDKLNIEAVKTNENVWMWRWKQ